MHERTRDLFDHDVMNAEMSYSGKRIVTEIVYLVVVVGRRFNLPQLTGPSRLCESREAPDWSARVTGLTQDGISGPGVNTTAAVAGAESRPTNSIRATKCKYKRRSPRRPAPRRAQRPPLILSGLMTFTHRRQKPQRG